MNRLFSAIENIVLDKNIEKDFKAHITSKIVDINPFIDDFRTLKGDLKRTFCHTFFFKDNKLKLNFHKNIVFHIFKEAKTGYIQGMIDWISVFIVLYFEEDISNLNLVFEEYPDPELYNYDNIKKEEKQEKKYKNLCCYVAYKNSKNIKTFNSFIEEHKEEIRRLCILTFYYNTKFVWKNVEDPISCLKLFDPIYYSLNTENKSGISEPRTLFLLKFSFFVCWFTREIRNKEYLFIIYSKILEEGEIESIFIIYWMFVQKYQKYKQDINIYSKSNGSIKSRMDDFDTLYDTSKIKFFAMKKKLDSNSNSNGNGNFIIAAAAIGIAAALFYQNKNNQHKKDDEDDDDD